jgi:hypothetical protein
MDQLHARNGAPEVVAEDRRTPGGRASVIRSSTTTLLVAVLLLGCSSLVGGPGGSHGATPPPGVGIVGTWQTTITKDDLRRAGISDPGLLNENAGRFTRTFLADGTWTIAQESLDASPIHNPVWRGTYAIEGDEIRVLIEFPPEGAGDTERYRWAVDGNELRLTLLEPTDDPLARVGTESHPWTRTNP